MAIHNPEEILKIAAVKNASDVFIISGQPLSYKIDGQIVKHDDEKLMPDDTEAIINKIYELSSDRNLTRVSDGGDDDFSFSIPKVARFRVSAYKQRGTLAAVIRIVAFDLPEPASLGIPPIVLAQGDLKKGLMLVTGPAGSGKSTTLACVIDKINNDFNDHIITMEDPIEYLHRHKKSIVSQREISLDTESYVHALRAALRQAPDVILLGELRDSETIDIAMTAAETGHLVISTLHTVGAANTIDRVIDAFPAEQQGQIRVQLAMVLKSVISQQLVPAIDGGVIPVFEIMLVNDAIKNMIRESKIHQIDSVITSSQAEGMVTMDGSLIKLFKEGKITEETALAFAVQPDLMKRRMSL
ncbi:MAG: PilT/PilU family type 4a pilus ATPase [Clostridiales Family XIII bacterium]|jgi:twitching motility protein PilT|nr:PilT/PilU family type 4a pilus ATPase [Clostridiales Family XIII bacterium]